MLLFASTYAIVLVVLVFVMSLVLRRSSIYLHDERAIAETTQTMLPAPPTKSVNQGSPGTFTLAPARSPARRGFQQSHDDFFSSHYGGVLPTMVVEAPHWHVNTRIAREMLFQTDRLTKLYGTGDSEVCALNEVSIDITSGTTALTGPNGSGKSTLLNMLGGLDLPTYGGVLLRGKPIPFHRNGRLADYRLRIAYIRQDLNLFADQCARDNVAFALTRSGVSLSRARDLALGQLAELGVDKNTARRLPGMMSGGQRQRTAIARAILAASHGAEVILADEPTASVDSADAPRVFKQMLDLAQSQKIPVVVVTHNPELANMADRVLLCRDGKVCDAARASSIRCTIERNEHV